MLRTNPEIQLTPDQQKQVEKVLSRFQRVRQSGADNTKFTALCPAHDDHHPSLSITVLNDKILIYCHAGCSIENILSAAGLTFQDLFLDNNRLDEPDQTLMHWLWELCQKSQPLTLLIIEKIQSTLPPEKINRFNTTDAGNAELFAELFGDVVRFNHRTKQWLVWRKYWWEEDKNGEVMRMAKIVIRLRYISAVEFAKNGEKKKLKNWALRSETLQRMEAMLKLARSEEPIADKGEGWDEDPWLLGVGNGVINLKTGELIAGKPGQKISRHIEFDYDPNILLDPNHPQYPKRWLKFLDEVFCNDKELIDFIHRAIGYSLTGITDEQCLFVCYGTGANGKSEFLSILHYILGNYAENTSFSTFEANGRYKIPNDLAQLAGARLVTASETSDGVRLNESRIKCLTGGDPITARFLHQEHFTFYPTMKIWLACNHKPIVNDDSKGFWRRVHLIPFHNTFNKYDDPNLRETLRREAPGILAWAVEGCLRWQKEGLKPPRIVKQATDEYEAENDPLKDWLTECCIINKNARLRASDGYRSYQKWCEEVGIKERERLSMNAWGRRMTNKFPKARDDRGNFYQGLSLKPHYNEFNHNLEELK